LIHYNSFKAAKSLSVLKARFEQELPEYLKWGIHVMVSQNGKGELIIGDSHEYANTFDPFDKQFINTMITDYLRTFATFKSDKISASWNGIYPKLTNGNAYLFEQVDPGLYLFNGLSGAGMTLSFGLSTKLVEGI
jgi:glycine/D-amino acid oxidase-like deaminating enzyme